MPEETLKTEPETASASALALADRRQRLAPTALSQYVGLDNCERYLWFYLNRGETTRLTRRLAVQTELAGTSWVPVQPLSSLLEGLGNRIEGEVVANLENQGYRVRDLGELDVPGATEVLAASYRSQASDACFLYQVPMRGRLGHWPFEGRADLVQVAFNPATARLDVLVIDVKASRKDKVQHRLQVAVYVRMLQQMCDGAGIELGEVRGAIVRRTQEGVLQDPAQAQPFDLAPYLDTVRYLTEDAASPLQRVEAVGNDLARLHYYLGPRCDGCSFGPVCVTETAQRQDLSLIPFLESSDKRVLNGAGINTLAELAALKEFVATSSSGPAPTAATPETAEETEQGEAELPYPTVSPSRLAKPEAGVSVKLRLQTAPGKEDLVAELSRRWPLAPRLDRLIQRAALARRAFDHTTPARRYFVDRQPARRSTRSNLPDDKLYPNLIKIFLEVQLDYLEDRLYLAAALVQCGSRTEAVVRLSQDVPTDQSERTLLLDWVGGVLAAVGRVAGEAEAAPVHLYLYDRRDQKALLQALRRHLGSLEALPALYHLLTDTPALTQPALAFLYDEVRERLNLAGPLASLPVVSRQLGFEWKDEAGQDFARLFRVGLFDYGLRRNDGAYIHTAARFHSGLPLEYAYGAWGRLAAAEGAGPRYGRVSLAQIEAFARHRLHALAHIEGSFTYKNSFLVKEPLSLAAFVAVPEEPSSEGNLARVLEDFLHIEQYASLQEHLELFARPILRRVEVGRALLVRCTEIETTPISRRRKALHATFLAEFDKVGLHPQTALQVSKLKEGDFVTFNLLEEDGQPWKIVGGRLARIEELRGEWVRLELSGSSLGQGQSSRFRYFHERELLPQPGQYYIIDEMVDNLNGDKLLEACRHAAANALYRRAVEGLNAVWPSLAYLDGTPTSLEAVPDSAISSVEEVSALNLAPKESRVVAEASTFDLDLENEGVDGYDGEVIDLESLAAEWGRLVEAVEGTERAPTADQLEVIVGHLAEPLLLVQGPPGTGKSHTLGWAVLARLFLAVCQQPLPPPPAPSKKRKKKTAPDAQETPSVSLPLPVGPCFRVVVSSQTHNAVEIVLQSLAQKYVLLQGYLAANPDESFFGQRLAYLLAQLKLYKIGGSEAEARPPQIGFIDPWDREGVKAALGDPALPLEAGQLLVVGATPGNLYNLMKEYYGRGKKKEATVWEEKFFDLLVLDEASQINLPHALLAAAWLRPQAPVLVVGDHRQLAPILTHGWEHEENLSAVGLRPYRSVFQFLLDAGWPRVALNESFRLHPAQAAFLQETIYRQDGIHFHSRRTKRLSALPNDPALSPFVKAVLDPTYPIILIEHSEAASQQYNPVEVDLLSPLIAAATGGLGLSGRDGIGIVVPHRAQKAVLQERFPALARAGAIDTVERFQGGERDLIIVSTTASDPDYIAAEAEFLLSPNRFNVALSRPRCKLILVTSRSLLSFVSARLELFEQAQLWKRLAALCQSEQLWSGSAHQVLSWAESFEAARKPPVQISVYGHRG